MLFSRDDISRLRQKYLEKNVPKLYKYLRRMMIDEQQDEVKLTATSDERAKPQTLCIMLPGRHDPMKIKRLVLQQHQWPHIQTLLEEKGFMIELSDHYITIKPKPL